VYWQQARSKDGRGQSAPGITNKKIAWQPEKPDRNNAHYCQKNNR
jgi:hypothetical protein